MSNINLFSSTPTFDIQGNLWMLICFTFSISHPLAFVLGEFGSVGYKLIFLHSEKFACLSYTSTAHFSRPHLKTATFSFHKVEQNKFFPRWDIWNKPFVLCVCTIHWMSVCVTHGQKTWLDHGPWPWETQTFHVFHCDFAKSNLTDVFAHTLFRVSSHILKYSIWVFCACLFQFLPWLDLAVLASIFTIIHENLGESCEVAVLS